MRKKKLILFGAVAAMFISLSAASHTVDDVLELEHTADESDYTFFQDEQLVQYVSAMTREEVNGDWEEREVHSNMSYSEFAEKEASEFAAEKLREEMFERLNAEESENLNVGSKADEDHGRALEVRFTGFSDDDEQSPEYDYSDVQGVLPDEVQVAISFADTSETVNMPVSSTENEVVILPTAEELEEEAEMDQPAESWEGDSWNLDVEEASSQCWDGTDREEIRSPEFDGNKLSFSSSIEASNPCHTIGDAEVTKDGNSYTLELTTEGTDPICIECVGAVRYNAEFKAEEPFELELVHDGETVDRVQHPEFNGEDVTERPSLIQRIRSMFRGLFR